MSKKHTKHTHKKGQSGGGTRTVETLRGNTAQQAPTSSAPENLLGHPVIRRLVDEKVQRGPVTPGLEIDPDTLLDNPVIRRLVDKSIGHGPFGSGLDSSPS